MGPFEIQWRTSTKKDLRKIPPQDVARIVAAVTELAREPFPHGVDPPPAQTDVDRFLWRDRFQARAHLVDPDPDLVLPVVVRAEPVVEGVGLLEFVHLGGIDLDGRHRQAFSWCDNLSGPRRSSARA